VRARSNTGLSATTTGATVTKRPNVYLTITVPHVLGAPAVSQELIRANRNCMHRRVLCGYRKSRRRTFEPGPSSQLTRRWREMDSNFRYAGAVNPVVAPFMPPNARDGSMRPLSFRTARRPASTARGISTPGVRLRQEFAVWPRPGRRGPDRRGRNPCQRRHSRDRRDCGVAQDSAGDELGCSTRSVSRLTTPGIRIFSSGIFASCHTRHSCS
jgi:hypothetical protein